jgi:hypothetical protein
MAKKIEPPNPFQGRWRIVSMDCWEQEYVDEEEEGYFEFITPGRGRFHFAYVDGEMAVEWSWNGNDEMDPAQGRGWAVIKGAELHGMIFIHGGDESAFVGKRVTARKRPRTEVACRCGRRSTRWGRQRIRSESALKVVSVGLKCRPEPKVENDT